MPLGVPPPLALALSLPGAAVGCWACPRRVMSAAKAATNTSAIRSFMTDDCTRNGGRLLRGQVQRLSVASQFVTMELWPRVLDQVNRRPVVEGIDALGCRW